MHPTLKQPNRTRKFPPTDMPWNDLRRSAVGAWSCCGASEYRPTAGATDVPRALRQGDHHRPGTHGVLHTGRSRRCHGRAIDCFARRLGADPAYMTWAPQFYPSKKLIVHHTATSDSYTDRRRG
jgi:hypothetical protein